MRNRDPRQRDYFRRCARQLMEQEWEAGRHPTLRQVAEMTLEQTRPSRYYLDYDNAISTLHRLARSGAPLNCRRGQRGQRAMWAELAQRVQQRQATHPGETLGRALQHILTESRPSKWHISLTTALRWL